MGRKIISIWSIVLVLVFSIAVVVPGCTTPTTGTIEVKATLDSVAWPSSGTDSVDYTLTPQSGSPIDGDTVPDTFTVDAGNWTCAYVAGGPVGADFIDITTSETQEVTAGGNPVTFTLNFVTPQEVDASVVFVTWTIDGVPVPPGQYLINPGTVVDAQYEEVVSGNQTGQPVKVKETLWTKYHYMGIEGQPTENPRTLHVVNAWGAVWANPPFEQKLSQQATVEGVAVAPCTNIQCPYCETINLDVEIETVQKVGTNYTKSVNWIRFNPSGGGQGLIALNGGEGEGEGEGEIFEDVAPYVGWETFTLTTWACIEVGAGFVDTNQNNDCCPESPQITIWYNPPS
jgi:hypothetical protein